MEPLYVRMLGEFSLQAGCVQISDRSSRSKKVWVMLAYLLNHRRQIVSRKELVDLLWRDESSSSNPENTLKVTLHRARTLLNELWPQAGHQLILFKNGGYTWNTDIPMIVDADEFERLCKSRYEDSEEQIEALLNAIALYRGEFLGSLSAETWTVSMTTYFHNLYIQTVLDVVPLLAAGDRHEDVVTVCKEALLLEAYYEPLHQHLMQAMLAQGDYKGTAAVYEKLSQQMFDEMGVSQVRRQWRFIGRHCRLSAARAFQWRRYWLIFRNRTRKVLCSVIMIISRFFAMRRRALPEETGNLCILR